MVDDRSPLYVQVMNYLLEEIEHEYHPGDLIPTQKEISEETDTSLITVKRAISELVNDGYLETIAGKGTFVRQPLVKDEHTGISSWTDTIAGLGEIPDTAWIDTETRQPPTYIANILNIKSGAQTVFVKRLRTINKKPVCLMNNEFPLELVPNMANESIDSESIYEWIEEKYDITPAVAEEEVYARQASDQERKELQMDYHIVLVIKRVSYLEDETPLEFSQIVAPADSYRYEAKYVNKSLESTASEQPFKHVHP